MNRIAMLRKKQNLSQKELGSIIGVAQNTISNWENGNREPDFNTALRIANYFHVSVGYLLGQDEEKPPAESEELSDDELRLLSAYRAASGKRKEAVLDLLED